MNKIVLITGSNKGIGFGIAQRLLQEAPEFSTIILTARNPELGLHAQSLLGNNERTAFHPLDVTSQDSINSVAKYIADNFGQIDVLVNNAGWAAKGDAFDIDVVTTTIGTNFYGLKHVTEAFLPLLKPNGHIVNISSSAGVTRYLGNPELAQRFLNPDLTQEEIISLAEEFKNYVRDGNWTEKGWPTFGYGVSKNLVNSYTRVLHRDLKKSGSQIRVNAVHPGWVRTDMAGQEADLSIEEGSVFSVRVIRDTSDLSGRYWADGDHHDFY